MYDSVTKFLFETFSEDYATWLLGKPIALTKLEPSELSLEPIRADSLIFLEGEDVILHIESQTQPQEDLFFRLLDYRVRLYRRSPLKSVKQVVRSSTLPKPDPVWSIGLALKFQAPAMSLRSSGCGSNLWNYSLIVQACYP